MRTLVLAAAALPVTIALFASVSRGQEVILDQNFNDTSEFPTNVGITATGDGTTTGGRWGANDSTTPLPTPVANPAGAGDQAIQITRNGGGVTGLLGYRSDGTAANIGTTFTFQFSVYRNQSTSSFSINANNDTIFQSSFPLGLYVDPTGLLYSEVTSEAGYVPRGFVIPAATWTQLQMVVNTAAGTYNLFGTIGANPQTQILTNYPYNTGDLGNVDAVQFDPSGNVGESFDVEDVSLTTATIPAQWMPNASGDWNVSSNWTTGIVPNAVDAEADFFGAITSNQSVFTDTAITVGTINFNNANTYQINGTGSLTLQTSTGNAQVIVQQGTHELNLPTTIASNTVFNVSSGANLIVANPLTINSGETLTQTGAGTVTYNSIITVGATGAIAFGNSTHALQLNLASGSTASVGGTGTVLELDSLSNGGTLDLQKNALIINYGSGADPIATIQAEITSGYAGGAWNGVGINSSVAQTTSGSYGLGYADSADPGNPAGLASGTIEVVYTLLGDANLDGAVNGTDFAILASNFNKAVNGWDQGDFNYDGAANGTDFALLASNFNKGTTIAVADVAALDSFAAANGLLTSVPEPACGSLAAMAAVGLLRRRRRSKSADFAAV